MKKKIHIKTISLGSEPDIPTISELKEFIASYKGIEADLITYQLLRSYSSQKSASIGEIAVGGTFCRSRMDESLSWDEEEGPLVNPDALIRDYSLITMHDRYVRSVHESPSILSSAPSPDDEDGFAEICHGFRQVLRTLRDNYISGHVIHLENPTPLELELLSSPKNLFFLHNPTLENLGDLLEHSRDLILSPEKVSLVDELMDRYQVRTLSVCDATDTSLLDALQFLEPDHLKYAGYCQGPEEAYWKKVKKSAFISV